MKKNKNTLNINKPLLKKVLSVQTKSKKDDDMITFLKAYITNDLRLEYEEDDYGNIYVTKGESDIYPCIVAHTDTVHALIDDKNFQVKEIKNNLYAFDAEEIEQVGIGGDDKVGIYLALELVSNLNKIKAVFYRDEEIGHLGSDFSIKNKIDFYKNVGFIVEGDRKGAHDFITKSSGIKLCSNKFIEDVTPIAKKYNYKETTGVSTDVDTLVRHGVGISCANISVGYYRPHTSKEVVDILDVNNAYNFACALFKSMGETKYEYEYVPVVYSYSGYGSNYPSTNISTELVSVSPKVTTYGNKFTSRTKYNKFNSYDYSSNYQDWTEYELEQSIFESYIKMKGEHSKCKSGNIVFIPAEERFYCMKCGEYIEKYTKEENALCKKLQIKSENTYFVYDGVNSVWLKKSDAVWNDFYSTYMSHSDNKDYERYEKQYRTTG